MRTFTAQATCARYLLLKRSREPRVVKETPTQTGRQGEARAARAAGREGRTSRVGHPGHEGQVPRVVRVGRVGRELRDSREIARVRDRSRDRDSPR